MSEWSREERQDLVKIVLGHLPVEEVLDRYSVRIRGRTRSRKGGWELAAACPFHETTSPNFTINDATSKWICRSAYCGKGGDLIRFIALQEDCSDDRAWIRLCAMARIEPPKSDALGRMLSSLASIGSIESVQHADAPKPMAWPIGYERMAHPYLIQKRGLKPRVLLDAGAGKIDGDPFYQYRACVPIIRGGDLYSMYSRATGSQSAWCRKYPNDAHKVQSRYPRHHYTSESLTSQQLYGLDEVEGSTVILVEAVISVLKLRSLGFRGAVALLKAKISREQILMLMTRGFSRVIICTDNDRKESKEHPGTYINPGADASWGIYHKLKEHFETGVARLPVNVDPADMSVPEEFQEVMEGVRWPQGRSVDLDALGRWFEET